MSFTAGTIINRVRPQLGDPNGNAWQDGQLRSAIDSGVDLLRQNIPELQLSDDGLVSSFEASSLMANTDAIGLPDFYISPLEQYVLWLCFQGDAGDERDLSRAQSAAGQFTALTNIPLITPSRR